MSVASRGLSSTCSTCKRLLTPRLWPDQAEANGETHEAGDVVYVELGHDPAAVGVDAAWPYAENGGDFLACSAFDDELQDLTFARTELAQRVSFSFFHRWQQET